MEREGERRRRSGACVRAARHNGGKEQSKPLISRGEVKVASRKHLREAKAARGGSGIGGEVYKRSRIRVRAERLSPVVNRQGESEKREFILGKRQGSRGEARRVE